MLRRDGDRSGAGVWRSETHELVRRAQATAQESSVWSDGLRKHEDAHDGGRAEAGI